MKPTIVALLLLSSVYGLAQPVTVFNIASSRSLTRSIEVREWQADLADLAVGPKWNGAGDPHFDGKHLEEVARKWFSVLYPNGSAGDLKWKRIQRVNDAAEGYGWFGVFTFEGSTSSSIRLGWISAPPDPIVVLSSGKPLVCYFKKEK
jgi:hypothetical protein